MKKADASSLCEVERSDARAPRTGAIGKTCVAYRTRQAVTIPTPPPPAAHARAEAYRNRVENPASPWFGIANAAIARLAPNSDQLPSPREVAGWHCGCSPLDDSRERRPCGQVRESGVANREIGDAAAKEGDAQERFRPAREKPQAGDRDRAERGAEERCQGTLETASGRSKEVTR